jgi:ABC-type multidrug transport system fused ATPase/permease subunit
LPDQDEALWRWLGLLDLKGTVLALPDALDTSTDSICLSLGQCQLLCVARALLRQTVLLIMDEATSALDSHSEELVEVALAESGAGQQTRLAIAHHLHTIFGFDQVLVLDGGEVVEFGPPSALVASCGVFAALAAAQTSGSISAAAEAVELARKRAISR